MRIVQYNPDISRKATVASYLLAGHNRLLLVVPCNKVVQDQAATQNPGIQPEVPVFSPSNTNQVCLIEPQYNAVE